MGEDSDVLTIFHAQKKPSISISDYVHRVGLYASCSRVCFLAAIIYMERICSEQHSLTVNTLNVHRLFITAVTCAVKFFDDVYYKNSYYASIGGVPVKEMNALELNFLTLIRYHLFVTKEELNQVERIIINDVMLSCDEQASNLQRTLIQNGCAMPHSLCSNTQKKAVTDLVGASCHTEQRPDRRWSSPFNRGEDQRMKERHPPACSQDNASTLSIWPCGFVSASSPGQCQSS